MISLTTLSIVQIVLSVIMIGLILLQRPVSDAGLSGSDSGAGHTKRGIEKLIFQLSIIVAVLFTLSALAPLFINQ